MPGHPPSESRSIPMSSNLPYTPSGRLTPAARQDRVTPIGVQHGRTRSACRWSRWFRQPGPGGRLDRPSTRRGCRSARAVLARPPASLAHPLTVIQVAHEAVEGRGPARSQELHRQDRLAGKARERVRLSHETDPGDLIDPHGHRPACRVVAELDVPPPPVRRSAEHRYRHSGQVRGASAVAEDEDQQPGPRQVRDQTFQFAGGLADICGVAPLVLLARVGAVSGSQHGARAARAGVAGGAVSVPLSRGTRRGWG